VRPDLTSLASNHQSIRLGQHAIIRAERESWQPARMRRALIDLEMQTKRNDPALHAKCSEIRDPDLLDRPLHELEAVVAQTRHAGPTCE